MKAKFKVGDKVVCIRKERPYDFNDFGYMDYLLDKKTVAEVKQQGITYGEIERLVEESETKSDAVKEVHRVAKAGEYIKLTNAPFSFNEIGDIMKVDGTDNNIAYIFAKNHKRDTGNIIGNNVWYYNKNSYVVLENYKPKEI